VDHFSYVMALVSIVVGLALTHVLGALGSAVHRLRGHGAPIRLEAVYLCWIGYILIWLVSFWWWEFKLHEMQVEWSYPLYLFLIGYATLLFLSVVVLVPRDMEGVEDSFTYFMAGRRWFLCMVLLLLAVDMGDSWIKGATWATSTYYLASEALSAAACIVAILSERRGVQTAVAFAMFGYQLYYVWDTMEILGRW